MRRKPQLTGPDYLIAHAHLASENEQPYAEDFEAMITDVYSEREHFAREVIAKRPLKDYEASPVSIILTAAERAASENDSESVAEVFRVGLTLLAKWHEYLLFGAEGHPEFELKRATRNERERQ